MKHKQMNRLLLVVDTGYVCYRCAITLEVARRQGENQSRLQAPGGIPPAWREFRVTPECPGCQMCRCMGIVCRHSILIDGISEKPRQRRRLVGEDAWELK